MDVQQLLNDIELDVAELKCLLQTSSQEADPRLTAVAGRNIERLKQRLDELQQVCFPSEKASLPPKKSRTSSEEEGTAAGVPILAERLHPDRDLRHALSLNDSFRFSRELFNGDTVRMNQLLAQLSGAHAWEEAYNLLASEIEMTDDNTVATEFEELLKKYFDR